MTVGIQTRTHSRVIIEGAIYLFIIVVFCYLKWSTKKFTHQAEFPNEINTDPTLFFVLLRATVSSNEEEKIRIIYLSLNLCVYVFFCILS